MIDLIITLAVTFIALVLIAVGIGYAASWAVACATLGGILLALVVLSRLAIRRPVE